MNKNIIIVGLMCSVIVLIAVVFLLNSENVECPECDWCKDIHDKCPDEIKAECETGDYSEFNEEQLKSFRKIKEFWYERGEHICDLKQDFLDFYCEGY